MHLRHDETRGVTGYVPLGAACTTICSVEYGTLQGGCTYAMTRQEESLVMFPKAQLALRSVLSSMEHQRVCAPTP